MVLRTKKESEVEREREQWSGEKEEWSGEREKWSGEREERTQSNEGEEVVRKRMRKRELAKVRQKDW